jgi:single-strand DNA-binding protein
MSYQMSQIIGRLGADPELRYTPTGQSVTNFSVATNRKYNKADGEEVKEILWFKVTVWGKLAEACNTCLHKGSQVFIQGRLIADPTTGGPRIWSRQNGSPAASFEINAEAVRFLDGKNGNGQSDQPAASSEEAEIPF